MDLFVYGTLLDPDLRAAVAGPGLTGEAESDPALEKMVDLDHTAGSTHGTRPATLTDWRVQTLRGDVVPLIEPASGASCAGLVWSGLTDVQLARVALYERAFGYVPIDVAVTADGATIPARVWVPAHEAQTGEGAWAFQAWQARYAATSVLVAREIFALDPRPTPEEVRAQFPMMRRRAWNRLQAARRSTPAQVRRAAAPGDVSVGARTAPAGTFFRLQGFEVTHRRFDGDRQGPLPREVLVGTDAVLILPYDPRRDRVVLVEQIRMGALENGTPNPWTLEPVAGMIDAFEEPETAALRETREEAGLEVTLRKAMTGYASPGNATDYFHCFAGICDLPDDLPGRWSGGLADEHEDLRLHLMTLDAALALVDSGEITALPCVGLLHWTALNRDRLRLEFAAGEVR